MKRTQWRVLAVAALLILGAGIVLALLMPWGRGTERMSFAKPGHYRIRALFGTRLSRVLYALRPACS